MFFSHSWLVLPQTSSPHRAICPCVLVLKSCAEFIVLIDVHCASSLWYACFSVRREVICLYLRAVTLPKISQQWRAVLTDPEPVDLAYECSHNWTRWFHTILFLSRSSFTATDRQWMHTLCLSGSGQIFWLGFGTWRVTHPVAAIWGVRNTHRTPTRHETQAGAFMICKQ